VVPAILFVATSPGADYFTSIEFAVREPHPVASALSGSDKELIFVRLASRLIAIEEPGECARAVMDAADAILSWDAGFVSLFDEEQGTATNLYIADTMDEGKVELADEYLRPREASPLFRRAVSEGPLLLRWEDVNHTPSKYHFGRVGSHTESLLYVPIRDRTMRPIGLLSLQSYTVGKYGEEALRIGQLLADLCASSLERARTAASLQASEQRLSLLLEEIPAILWTIDGDLRFTSSQGAGLRELGLRSQQVIGLHLRDFMGGTGDLTLDAHRRALAGEIVVYDEAFYGRHYHVACKPLRTPNGTISGVAGVALDTTQLANAEQNRRELESRMLQTQKMESLGILAGGIAHDFNNLLVGVIGNSGMAQSELPPDHPAMESLKEVDRAAARMKDLTRQLLAYAGRGKFQSRTVDLTQLLRETQDLLRASTSGNVEMIYQLNAGPLPILGDSTLLRQMLLNVVSNASDSLAESTGSITVSARQEGNRAVLEVADSGCGISPEVQSRIFDPFYSTKGDGRGLGLAAVQGIVRSHDGEITLESSPGHGTTVQIRFPLAATPAPPAAVEAPARLRGRILLADDEVVIREFVRKSLERLGLEVVTAKDGEEALNLFTTQRDRIQLAVLDIIMPRLGGPAAYLKMREQAPKLPVLFISGASDKDLLKHGLRVTPENFLEKPFTRDDLAAKVRAFF
jgi:PAS domain S-box-containing protein